MDIMTRWLVPFVILVTPGLAFAQEAAPAAPDDLGDMISQIIAAAQGGEWSVFAALIIMILVYLATRVKFISDLLPKAAIPWVAASAGMLAAVASIAFTEGDWLKAILGGLVTGAAASGLWELIGRQISKKASKDEEAKPDEEGEAE